MKIQSEFRTNIYFSIILLSLFIVDYFVKNINILFCPLNKILGLPCPFCGSSRAIYSILDLEFIKALNYNPSIYFILLLAVLVIISPLFKNRLKIPIIIVFTFIIFIYIYMMLFVYPHHEVFRYNEESLLANIIRFIF